MLVDLEGLCGSAEASEPIMSEEEERQLVVKEQVQAIINDTSHVPSNYRSKLDDLYNKGKVIYETFISMVK